MPRTSRACCPSRSRSSFALAKKRAQEINAQHPAHKAKDLRDPYTDVYEFVEEGLGITAY